MKAEAEVGDSWTAGGGGMGEYEGSMGDWARKMISLAPGVCN